MRFTVGEWVANALLGLIPASSDTVLSEGDRLIKAYTKVLLMGTVDFATAAPQNGF
jgi:hypothetical protein